MISLKKINYIIYKEVAAGATETITVTLPAAGIRYTLTKMLIHVPTGIDFALKVSLKRGEEDLLYGDKAIRTAQGTVQLYFNETGITSGELKVIIENTDTANPHKILIVLEFT